MRDGDAWNRLGNLFTEALELPVAARTAYLAEHCAGDSEALDETLRLLDANERMGSFLEKPGAALHRIAVELQPGGLP